MKLQSFNSQLLALIKQIAIGVGCVVIVSSTVQAAAASLELLPSPAPASSSLSRVVSDESGQIYLSWVSQEAGQARLSYARLAENGWTTPEVISQGNDWFVNWADFPALSVNAGNLTAHWLKMSAAGTYDYDIYARFYDAHARTWSEEKKIHTDGVSAEHGFVSMLPMAQDRTFISWLDGRETAKDNGAMTLRGGIFDPSGATVSEWELDHRVCDCCQTSSAMTPEGPIVVYRDRSENEIRDIYTTRYINGEWTVPQPVHNDEWQISGCPVNGPAIAARNNLVVVSWFTAKDDNPKVQLAISQDNGENFSAPVLVANHNTNGRVDTAILSSGRFVVSWIDTTSPEAKIVLSLYSSDGMLIESTQVAATNASRRSGFPIIEGVGESVYVTWTDIAEFSQVKVARVSYQNR